MQLISDEILIDSGQKLPINDATYPMLNEFRFWDPAAWIDGHPFEVYKHMREQAPVMWSPTEKDISGFGLLLVMKTLSIWSLLIEFFRPNVAVSTWQYQNAGIGAPKSSCLRP